MGPYSNMPDGMVVGGAADTESLRLSIVETKEGNKRKDAEIKRLTATLASMARNDKGAPSQSNTRLMLFFLIGPVGIGGCRLYRCHLDRETAVQRWLRHACMRACASVRACVHDRVQQQLRVER